MAITRRRAEYLRFMRGFFEDNDQLPPVSVLAAGMGVNPNAANDVLVRLMRDGVIKKNSVGKWMFAR